MSSISNSKQQEFIDIIDIFKKHKVGIGISLDGNKETNNKFRVDKLGNGTYDKVIQKIKLCQEHKLRFGLLAVVDPAVSGSQTYRHFVNDFSRKSIYCSSLKYFYKNVLKYFLNNGYTQQQMQNFLGVN